MRGRVQGRQGLRPAGRPLCLEAWRGTTPQGKQPEPRLDGEERVVEIKEEMGRDGPATGLALDRGQRGASQDSGGE